MTRLACGSGAVEATMFGWEWEECPSIQLDYAISLDRPRFQLLGMLHEVNRATRQKTKVVMLRVAEGRVHLVGAGCIEQLR